MKKFSRMAAVTLATVIASLGVVTIQTTSASADTGWGFRPVPKIAKHVP